MMTGVTQLVFATTEEADNGGRDNEGDAHSAAGGGGDNNGITAGIWNEDIIVFVMDCAGSASDVDAIFEPFRK